MGRFVTGGGVDIRGAVEEEGSVMRIGMTELVFTPTVARIDQVDQLADLVL